MRARQQPHLSPADTARLSRASMLLDGRTRVLRAGPHLVEAVVFLIDGGQYRLGYRAGEWWCQCGSPRPPCGHVRALQLVTMPDQVPLTRGSGIPSESETRRSQPRHQGHAREIRRLQPMTGGFSVRSATSGLCKVRQAPERARSLASRLEEGPGEDGRGC